MLRYIDLTDDRFVLQRRLSGWPVEREIVKRGATEPISVQFVRNCQVVELDPAALGSFGLKLPGQANSPYFIVGPAGWVKSGSGSSTVYTFTPDFSGVALDSALGSADSITLAGAINWTDGGISYATLNQFEFVVLNQIIRGTESALFYPDGAPPIVLDKITRLVGGTSTDLDAIPLAAYPVGQLFDISILINGGAAKSDSRWQKTAWTQAQPPVSSPGTGMVATLDYNGSTNRFVLVRVIGL